MTASVILGASLPQKPPAVFVRASRGEGNPIGIHSTVPASTGARILTIEGAPPVPQRNS